MLISRFGYHSAAGCALQETLLKQKWFDNLFNGPRVFRNASCKSVKPYRPSSEHLYRLSKEVSIDAIEPSRVDL
jgi:hypothetical protein